MRDVMTAREVAELLRVTPLTIRRWLERGEITGVKTPAGWRLTRDDVTGWLSRYRERRERLAQGQTALPDDTTPALAARNDGENGEESGSGTR